MLRTSTKDNSLLASIVILVLIVISGHIETQNIRKVVSVIPGQTAVLKCFNDAAAPYGAKYQWEKPENNIISTSYEISIPNVSQREVGIYVCRMIVNINNRRSESTAYVKLELRDAGSRFPPYPNNGQTDYTLAITHSPVNVQMNRRLTLECQAVPPTNGVTFQWFIQNVPSGNGATLVIDSFSAKDSAKEYKCTTTYMGRSAKSAVATFNFQVYADRELKLTNTPGPSIAVRIGDKKELHCEISNAFTGGRVLTGRDVLWFFNGQTITTQERYNLNRLDQQRVSILVLNRISKENEGRYECRLDNDVKEAFIIVIGGQSIAIEVNPPMNTVDEGRNAMVEFHCRISNHPTFKNRDLRWYFQPQIRGQRQPLRTGWDRKDHPVSDQTSFISIVSVTKSDEGYYVCETPDGRTAKAQLIVNARVVERIEIMITPDLIQGRPGQIYEAICNLRNNGRPFGEPLWRFENGLPLARDSRFRIDRLGPGMSKVTLLSLTSADNGLVLQCYYQSYSATLRISLTAVCGQSQFRCNNGQCVSSSSRCNGYRDCVDGSDEIQSMCVMCDPLEKKCEYVNGVAPLKKIYSANWKCDGEDDCGNGYDEQNCRNTGAQCGGTQFQCNNNDRRLIPMAFRCDKERDCQNGEDEDGCSQAPLVTNSGNTNFVQSVRTGSTVTFSCRGRATPLPTIIWRYNWRCLPDEGRMIVSSNTVACEYIESTITIRNVQSGDSGIYNCELISADKRAISRDYQLIVNVN